MSSVLRKHFTADASHTVNDLSNKKKRPALALSGKGAKAALHKRIL